MPVPRHEKEKKIFISWAGDNSKLIALKLKEALEDHIFQGCNLHCFVSDVNIQAGEDWWSTIKTELKACALGIAVVTKENLSAPWLFFESGAIIARDKPLIPLLFNCFHKHLDHTPLATKHMTNFYDFKQFKSMIYRINNIFGNLQPNTLALNSLISSGYKWLETELDPITKDLKMLRLFNEKYVYPSNVKTMSKGSIFVSSPMAAINEDEYIKLHGFIVSLEETLREIGFSEIISPVISKDSKEYFDGPAAAINDNYPKLKSVDSLLIIIPKMSSFTYVSSIWVDIGYCLALTKNIVIFHEDKLPYMLEAAGSYISHVHTYKYVYDSKSASPYEAIRKVIKQSGMALFMPSSITEDGE